jgi:hypothetical protein
MKSLSRVAFFLCLFVPSAFAQDLRLPRDPEKLIERVQTFWRHMASGQRLQAAEFVIPEKKNLFLSGNPVPVLKANVLGLDFTPDPNTANVRVTLGVLGTDLSTGPANWTISDPWIWRRGNWYVDIEDANQIFPAGRAISKADEKTIQDTIDKNFEILRDRFELGKLVDGQHFNIEVPIKYSGELPISIEPALPNPLITMPASLTITSTSKSFALFVGTDNWEGPFNFPVVLNLKYRNVVVERKLTVTGEVFIPLAFRQDPPNGPLVPDQEFSVFVRNNTEADIPIGYFSVDAKLDLTNKAPTVFPANQETEFRFKPRRGISPDTLYIELKAPLNGKLGYSWKFRNVSP